MLWRHHPVATLLVTHDIDEALMLADRVILIDDGTIDAETRVDVPHPRHRDDSAILRLRRKLLARLGVMEEENTETASDTRVISMA